MPSNKSTIDTYLEFHYDGGELVKATKHVKKFEGAGKSASSGINVLDVALGSLAAGGITSVISFAGQGLAALADFGAQSIELASNARETESLLTSALGPAYDDFSKSVDRVGDATGRSTREFKQAISPLLAMTKAQGFAADEAARTSVEFGKTALDLNSYFNSATGFEDIQSALAGSSETLQKYGINANVAALQQEALNLGLINAKGPLDQATRTTALLSLVQRQAADAMGDAERTSDGFANTQRALTDTYSDFKAEVGDGLINVLTPWQKLTSEIASDTLPELSKNIRGATDRMAEFSEAFVNSALESRDDPIRAAYDAYETLDTSVDARAQGYAAYGVVIDTVAEKTLKLAAANLQAAQSTGGEGRGGRGSFGIDVIQVESFDTALKSTNNTLQNLNIGDAFGNFTVDTNSLDSFFGSIDANTQSTIDNFQKIGRSISDVNAQISGLSSADIVSASGNAEDNALDAFASGLAGRGVSIEDQATALTAAGASLEEVNTRVRDALEQGAADVALAYIEAGKPVEEALSLLEDFQTQIDSEENPIDLATNDTLGLQDALAELGSSTFTPTVDFQVTGLDKIQEALALINESGAEFSLGEATENAFVGDSIQGNRGRAR